jgi:hypothetical protein
MAEVSVRCHAPASERTLLLAFGQHPQFDCKARIGARAMVSATA